MGISQVGNQHELFELEPGSDHVFPELSEVVTVSPADSFQDVDALYTRALRAGATSIQEPADQPYGDRTAPVKDPFGNVWYIAAPIKNAPRKELPKRAGVFYGRE